jgi:hypothetical protein
VDLKELIELERYKAELAIQLMERTEHFKSVILAGQSALKSAILINGGAVVALLTTWKAESSPTLLKLLAAPLLWFVAGVGLDAIATGATYLSQLCYALCGDARGKLFYTGVILHCLAASLVGASYVTFAYGTWLVYSALVK